MKDLIVIMLLLLAGSQLSKAQCIIYADDHTGAWAGGYNKDGTPTTWKYCDEVALKLCKSRGGVFCQILLKENKAGWWGLISGQTADDKTLFKTGNGYASKIDAERELRSAYKKAGGVDADRVEVVTWYVYSNLKY